MPGRPRRLRVVAGQQGHRVLQRVLQHPSGGGVHGPSGCVGPRSGGKTARATRYHVHDKRAALRVKSRHPGEAAFAGNDWVQVFMALIKGSTLVLFTIVGALAGCIADGESVTPDGSDAVVPSSGPA